MQTCFGPIFDTPFGTGGDLMIVPDASAEVRVDFGEGGIGARRSSISSSAISATPTAARGSAARASSCAGRSRRFKEASGLELTCAFEQEFVYTGIEDRPGHPYSLSAFRRQGPFGESLVAALRAGRRDARLLPHRIWTAPVRVHRRATARAQGGRPSRDRPRIGSLRRISSRTTRDLLANAGCRRHRQRRAYPFQPARREGRAADLSSVRPARLEPGSGAFRRRRACASRLRFPPSPRRRPCPIYRLTPNRWAPTNIDIVKQDRGAALRVCPVFAAAKRKDIARAFNLEFRVCEAAASPYMALGALIFAGADGIARKLSLPQAGAHAARSAAFARRGARHHGEERGGRGLVRTGVPRGLSPPQALGARSRANGSDEQELCARYAEVY